MRMTYCMRLPFEFPVGHNIHEVDLPAEADIVGYGAQLDRQHSSYVLTLKSLQSEDEAHEVLLKFHAAVLWAALELKTGIKVTGNPQDVFYANDPNVAGKNLGLGKPVDAIIDAAQPAVWREDKRVVRMSAGGVSVSKSIKADRFFGALAQGLDQVRPNAFEDREEAHERTKSAIELYMLSYFEQNRLPRFLLQCAALEVLAPRGELEPAHVVAQVDEWTAQALTRARDRLSAEKERNDFNRLANRIRMQRSVSHSERIRRFARELLSRVGVQNVENEVKSLISAYEVRSRFLHQADRHGIDNAAVTMHEMLPLLLKEALR